MIQSIRRPQMGARPTFLTIHLPQPTGSLPTLYHFITGWGDMGPRCQRCIPVGKNFFGGKLFPIGALKFPAIPFQCPQ